MFLQQSTYNLPEQILGDFMSNKYPGWIYYDGNKLELASNRDNQQITQFQLSI